VFSKDKSIEKINSLIERIDDLKKVARFSAGFKKWIRDTQVALEHIFGKESRHIHDFNIISYSLGGYSSSTPEHKFQQRYMDGLDTAKQILFSMIEEIKEYWNEDTEIVLTSPEQFQTTSKTQSSNKVFLIHGHDAGTKETVARFLTQIGLHAVILHEQANQGRTIIEKFENHADVGYAIALFTPDDVGSSVKEPENTRQRARQNVIFEFGYFIGKLGRDRVAGLIESDIEVPSDYSGVLYIPIDTSGAWRFLLIKELKSAGYEVDANKAI